MGDRLRELAGLLRGFGPEVRARPLCDTAPVLERAWAAQAGIGFVGKNGMLISPASGSFVVLGEVVTTLELPATAASATAGCGSCDACLKACPTGALIAPYVLDPRRCLSYATIESQGDPAPEATRAVTDQLFGCDCCQLACPFNSPAPDSRAPAGPFRALRRWQSLELAGLVELDEDRWRALSAGTALSRLSSTALARNVVVLAAARWRRGDPAGKRILERAVRHREPQIRALAARLLLPGVPGGAIEASGSSSNSAT
jgi:epoxyqueuosine reductase